jgi:hypothetical protein
LDCVGNDVSVGVAAVVDVGWGVEVTMNVDVGVEKSCVAVYVGVIVEKSIVWVGVGVFVGMGLLVDVTAGVRVGMFGTQRSCPL